jgi:hypothetical protein
MRVGASSSLASTLLLTLAACGGRSRSEIWRNCPASDADGDCQAPLDEGGNDCDDADPSVHPGAPDNGPSDAFRTEIFAAWEDIPYPFCLTMDRQGALHVLAADGSGFYATNRSGRWERLTLAGDPPRSGYCFLVADQDGLHLLYGEGTYDGPTFFATHPGLRDPDAPFSHETLTDDDRIYTTTLWRSRTGRTWAAYISETSGLMVAERTGASWQHEPIADFPGGGSLRLSGSDDGEPWLLTGGIREFYSEAYFSERIDGSWTTKTLNVDATSFMNIALAQHHSGVPELAFQYSRHGTYGPPGRFSRVEYGTRNGGDWDTTVVDDAIWVSCMDIGVDPNGVLRLAIVGHADQAEGSARELRIFEKGDAGWARSGGFEVDHVPTGSFCRPFVDSSGSVTLVAASEQNQVGVTGNRSDPDGVDQNCDGVDGMDADGDGIASRLTGGSDEDE